MAKYSGIIGFGIIQETNPSVYEETIVEKKCRGDVLSNYRKFKSIDKINSDSHNRIIRCVCRLCGYGNFYLCFRIWIGLIKIHGNSVCCATSSYFSKYRYLAGTADSHSGDGCAAVCRFCKDI